MEQTIELDCAPGNPRPDDLIAGVLEGTGLEVKPPVNKFFGNYTWDYSEVPEDKWLEVRKITVVGRGEMKYQLVVRQVQNKAFIARLGPQVSDFRSLEQLNQQVNVMLVSMVSNGLLNDDCYAEICYAEIESRDKR